MKNHTNMITLERETCTLTCCVGCITKKVTGIVLVVFVFLCGIQVSESFNVQTKNVKVFRGQPGTYFGYSLAFLQNSQANWVLVGAPKSNDRYQTAVQEPGVLYRCPADGAWTQCDQVVIDATGNSRVAGTFYGSTKIFLHDKSNQWLGISVDVSPNNGKIVTCAPRWKDAKFVATNNLLYMQGLCYELDGEFQLPARLIPILVDYNSLVHRQERYPIWAYGSLGQSVQYTKTGDGILMGAPGINDWQGGYVIEDNFRRNFTVQPFTDNKQNWLIGYTVTSAKLIRSEISYVVTGAPRAQLNGSVSIFESKTDKLIANPIVGHQLGSYFGSVICAADVNGDLLDDLIIGAPFYSSNYTEEGRVYVYINRGLFQLELQSDILNGSVADSARFGSAIADIGDINKDTFNDIAIGAPYENNGEGALYIYNGYTGGLWGKFTQRIMGTSVDAGIRSFGSSISGRSRLSGEAFAVGAYESDRVVVLRANPVVSIDTRLAMRPTIITKSQPYIDLVLCFRYQGDAATIPATLDIVYTMSVDTTTPEGSVRAIVVPNNVPYITRGLQIRQGELVCDQRIQIYAPYKDIMRDVEIKIHYELDNTVSSRCVQNCPILEKFNGRNPGVVRNLQDMYRSIQYDKQCGADNDCDPQLSVKVRPMINDGQYILTGQDKFLEVKVGLYNEGENAYNIIIDIVVVGNLSSAVRTHEVAVDTIVDCAPLDFDVEAHYELATYRCYVRKPYPLPSKAEMTFMLIFPLSNHITMQHFDANFTVLTENINTSKAITSISLPIKSLYNLRVEGVSEPEQVTVGLQQDDYPWTMVSHLYSIKNLGPSPLENAELYVMVPAIVHRKDALITNISAWVTTYNTDPAVKQRCFEASETANIPQSESSGGYAVSVDCASFPCQSFVCSIASFTKDQSILVSVELSVSRQIIARLQARDTVRLSSLVTIPEINYGKNLESEASTMFHKASNSMERKKLSIPIWLVVVSVVSAFLVLLVIIAILIKVGFFKRSKKEEMQRLRRSVIFPTTRASTGSQLNGGGSDMTGIVGAGIEDVDTDQAHDNPAAEIEKDPQEMHLYPQKH